MSEENVELARRSYEAFNQRDLGSFLALMDEEIEAESRLVAMEGGYHGHEGIRRWWSNLFGVFPDYELDVVEVRDLGDVTLARLVARGVGAASGTPLPQDHLWQPSRWRDGKCVRWSVHGTEADALEALARSK
jgi:ketosteroid isomerase-like protein